MVKYAYAEELDAAHICTQCQYTAKILKFFQKYPILRIYINR